MASLRQRLELGADEAVSVNQRSLVEKILSRYSGEQTVFRELLQNADDALATTVEIHFRTAQGGPKVLHSKEDLPNLKTTNIASITVRNDGIVFREEDWGRLKKIAEGNPDESKIGAFGVGFYSLFSLCDDPVVSSGEKAMLFYWKDGGDQLFVKTAATDTTGPESFTPEGKPWTTFLMELREAAPMPEPAEFARFLTTCLGFTAKIRSVSMHFDGHLLCRIGKTLAPPRSIPIRSNLPSTSPLRMLRITSIEEVPLQLNATVSRWMTLYATKPKEISSTVVNTASSFASRMLSAFSGKNSSSSSSIATLAPPPGTLDPFTILSANLFLRTVSANIKVTPTSHFSTEIVRSTKKGLPSNTTYSLIWTGKDEFDAGRPLETGGGAVENKGKGVDGDEEARRVFAGLMSDLETNGRVFIGFPTFQTTGCAASVAARFISTVEREALDFQEKTVNQWNRELLWCGGVLARTVYEEEMSDIARIYKRTINIDDEARIKLEERALHLMKFFTFSPSTPSPVVSFDTEIAFFLSLNQTSLTLVSQNGPLPASQVRLPNPQIAGFARSIPTVPALVSSGASKMMNTLREKNIVRDISLEDVLGDLATNAMTVPEAVECFKWWSALAQNTSYNPSLLQRLKDSALISIGEVNSKEVLAIQSLGSYTTFLNPKTISVDNPLPPHTLPFELSRSFTADQLSQVFGFAELSLVEWMRYLASAVMSGKGAKPETDLLSSPHFAEKILHILAKTFSNLSNLQQNELTELLQPLPFIPTTKGASLASAAYFSNVVLFEDLPIIRLPSEIAVKGSLEKLLTTLGVRRHVELQLVFTRLLGQGDWSHIELAKYLVSVRTSLSASEIDRLRKTAWLPKEGEAKIAVPPAEDGTVKKPRVPRYVASSLFEPTEVFRSLALPLVDWTSTQSRWRPSSDEAKFLFELGLLREPSVDQILQIAANPLNDERQEAALEYFLAQYGNPGFGSSYSAAKHNLPFIPALQNGVPLYGKPTMVYSNAAASVLGFATLLPRLQSDAVRLKLSIDPSCAEQVAAVLRNPPQTTSKARTIFSYLSTQVSKYPSSELQKLGAARIIPFESQSGSSMLSPNGCFFNTSSTLPPGLKSLFATIPDFGPAAQPFLVAIGVKDSPSTGEIASRMILDPRKFLDLCGSAEKYMAVTRMVGHNQSQLSPALRSRMKLSPFFLGYRRIATSAQKTSALLEDEDEDDYDSVLSYALGRPSDLVINDDPQACRSFETDILSVPQDETLEEFAALLGAQKISALVKEHYLKTGDPDISAACHKLAKTIKERTFLFLAERAQQHPRSEIVHDAEWLKGHLEIFEVRSIELVRSLQTEGGLKRHSQPASATATLVKGSVHLFIAGNTHVDYFEVGATLSKILLRKVRSSDPLLFSWMFSTSLSELKRKGINVDRIVNTRKQQQALAEQRLRAEQAAEQLTQVNNQRNASETSIGLPSGPPTLPDQSGKDRNQSETPVPSGPPTLPQRSSGLFSSLKKKINSSDPSKPSNGSANNRPLPISPFAPGVPIKDPSSVSGSTPASTEAIQRNVRKAIQDSRPENSSSIFSPEKRTMVKESETYCDSNGGANLNFVADIAGLRFFAHPTVPNIQSWLAVNSASLTRFIQLVLIPVGQVFGVNQKALHVFYDLDGPLIAFNRSGSIFFNHRYYLSWHDELVKNGDLNDPMISTFHTLAHELAHNLVGPHNSEHEYYFSTLCSTYFLRMAQLLAKNVQK